MVLVGGAMTKIWTRWILKWKNDKVVATTGEFAHRDTVNAFRHFNLPCSYAYRSIHVP